MSKILVLRILLRDHLYIFAAKDNVTTNIAEAEGINFLKAKKETVFFKPDIFWDPGGSEEKKLDRP